MGYSELVALRDEIRPYCELENDEHGETVNMLCNMVRYFDYLSDELTTLLEVELKEHLGTYRESCEIVERKETVTIRELVWDE